MPRRVLATVALLGGLLGCTAEPAADPPPTPVPTRAGSASSAPASSDSPTASTTTATTTPVEFDERAAMRTVRSLAAFGPREATSTAFQRAAELVEARFIALGYQVLRQRFWVPRGVSWGIPVPGGRTWNVVARPPDWSPTTSYVVIGAHLDTVPQSPGAEDNASGVAVLLELARLAEANGSRVPAVLVAYGGEEPRRSGDNGHHYGSRTHARNADLDRIAAMVSLDRVGAGRQVPVCTGGLSPRRVQRSLIAAARRIDVPVRRCENRTSDHWPFEKAGAVVARVGGNPSPGYHSSRDRPSNVNQHQLARVGSVMWEWLRPTPGR